MEKRNIRTTTGIAAHAIFGVYKHKRTDAVQFLRIHMSAEIVSIRFRTIEFIHSAHRIDQHMLKMVFNLLLVIFRQLSTIIAKPICS